MRSVFQEWLAAEFAVAEAEHQFRLEMRDHLHGHRRCAPETAPLIRAHVLRHETRAFLARVMPVLSAS